MTGGVLTAAERAVIRLSAALASRSEQRVLAAAQEAAEEGQREHVEEALLQSYLFLGYPAALNGFLVWRRVSGHLAPAAGPDRKDTWASDGARVCGVVYGGQYERLRAGVRALHPDMERWMIEEGYGKVLARSGMPLALRELCVSALLAVQNAPRQLYSHLRGALNAGASTDRIEAALDVALKESEIDSTAGHARAVWASVLERHKGTQDSGPWDPDVR